MRRRKCLSALAMLGGLALGLVPGCAAPSRPGKAVSQASLAVEEADTREVAMHAPLELRLAREKLDRAEAALREEEYTKARRLAEQALVDALLAEARAESETTRAGARELEKTIDALRLEAERGLEVEQ